MPMAAAANSTQCMQVLYSIMAMRVTENDIWATMFHGPCYSNLQSAAPTIPTIPTTTTVSSSIEFKHRAMVQSSAGMAPRSIAAILAASLLIGLGAMPMAAAAHST